MEVTQNMLLAGLIAGVCLICLVPIVGGLLYARRDRLLTHAERMKALEMGRDLPVGRSTARPGADGGGSERSGEAPSVAEKTLAAQCFSSTVLVVSGGLIFAWLSGGVMGAHSVAYAVAAAVGAIGVTGMICGTVLASKALRAAPDPAMMHPKPRFDPEAV